jgi:hypothetical protein
MSSEPPDAIFQRPPVLHTLALVRSEYPGSVLVPVKGFLSPYYPARFTLDEINYNYVPARF